MTNNWFDKEEAYRTNRNEDTMCTREADQILYSAGIRCSRNGNEEAATICFDLMNIVLEEPCLGLMRSEFEKWCKPDSATEYEPGYWRCWQAAWKLSARQYGDVR